MANLISGNDNGSYVWMRSDDDPPRVEINPPDVAGYLFEPGSLSQGHDDEASGWQPFAILTSPSINYPPDPDLGQLGTSSISMYGQAADLASRMLVESQAIDFQTTPTGSFTVNGREVPRGPRFRVDLIGDSTGMASATPAVVNGLTADSPGSPVDVTVEAQIFAGNTARVSFAHNGVKSTVAGDVVQLELRRDTTVVRRSGHIICTASGTAYAAGELAAYWTSDSNTHDWDVTIARISGTGSVSLAADSDAPAQLFIEDVGEQ